MSSRGSRQARRRRERVESRRGVKGKKRPNWPLIMGGGGAVALIVFVVVQGLTAGKGLPAPVAGLKCGSTEALVYHIHPYVELYDHGKRVQLPSEIGIPGTELNPTCFYWMHVHQQSANIIHIESPLPRTFTVGDFFDLWTARQNDPNPPGAAFVAKLANAARRNQVTAYYNLKPWKKPYRSMPLKNRAIVTLEIGKPRVKPTRFNFAGL